jgi:glucokinase
MSGHNLLIGDIGGTNARFALANHHYPGFHDVVELKCTDFKTSGDAIRHYLGRVDVESLGAICLAAAGPVVDHFIDITNNHWTLSASSLASEFDVEVVQLLNDFEAIAYSIPFIGAEDRLVVGPLKGTTGEGGHVGFAPETDLQAELLKVLRGRFERVSAERLVAGSGIENIYTALLEIRGEAVEPLGAAQIFEAATAPGNAYDAVHLFFEILGQVAGDLALTLGANDGVYIAGGIAKRYPETLQNGVFRAAFENKGRHRHLMERIPTFLITHEQPGLLGAAYCALELTGD